MHLAFFEIHLSRNINMSTSQTIRIKITLFNFKAKVKIVTNAAWRYDFARIG